MQRFLMTMKRLMMTNNLLEEWDYEKNVNVDPKDLKRSSGYNAWWKCPVCGGEWRTNVKNRTNGSGCPFCAGRMALRGKTDLQTLYPNIAMQWSEENVARPWEVTPGSHKKVKWKCKEGHQWMAEVKSRVSGSGCPYCSGRLAIPGKTDLRTLHPEVLDEWDWEKNVVDPSTITPYSSKKYWWVCKECGHEWQASLSHRVGGGKRKQKGCPYCNHKIVVPGKNDAATYNKEVAGEWDLEQNGGKPLSSFLPGSNHIGFWTCHVCGQSWAAQIQSRIVNKKGCPYCSGRKAVAGMTDLRTTRPDIAKEWDYLRNKGLMPEDMTEFSHKKAYWICGVCGRSWYAQIANRSNGRGCPYCSPNHGIGKKDKNE